MNLKLTELKREMDKPTITVKISTLLLIIDRAHREKINNQLGHKMSLNKFKRSKNHTIFSLTKIE